MKEEILNALREKLNEQHRATDKYQYRTGIFDCITIVEAIESSKQKIVVWKDGTYKIVLDGITTEYEQDENWLITI